MAPHAPQGEELARARPKMERYPVNSTRLAGGLRLPAFERSGTMTTTRRRGFTLIELLTVIAIIALLAAILFPVFARINENRRVAQCISNLQKIYTGASMYSTDNDGLYPLVLFDVAEKANGAPA